MNKNLEGSPKHGIKPALITKPHQLAAALLVGGIFLGGIFLASARVIDQPPWAAGVLVLAAIFSGLGGIAASYRLLTKHRDLLQDDVHYSKRHGEKNKDLQLRISEQKEHISQQEKLAEQRLSITLDYFDVVSRRLPLPDLERSRLRRALRETMRADEDHVLQLQARNLLLEADMVFTKAGAEHQALTGAILDRVQWARYQHLNRVYDDLVLQDIKQVELVSTLHRVAGVVIPVACEISSPQPPVEVKATLGILEVVFSEVMTNARQYSPSGSPIIIEVSKDSGTAVVSIRNRLLPGDVVSEQWFSSGYRGPSSAKLSVSGAGLGLPLVRRLLSLIQGDVSMEQRGTEAFLMLQFPM